jgi:cathepsin C
MLTTIKLICYLAFIACCASIAIADTPANCTYEDIRGQWVFHEGPRRNDKTVNCSANGWVRTKNFDYL